MNRINLQKIADHTRARAAKTFSMDLFLREVQTRDSVPDIPTEPPKCNTIACIIGDCINIDDPNFMPLLDEEWGAYSDRVSGLDCTSKLDDDIWNYLFSGEWVYADNTPTGAADRIEHVLAQGLPEDWRDQMEGEAPLSYMKEKEGE